VSLTLFTRSYHPLGTDKTHPQQDPLVKRPPPDELLRQNRPISNRLLKLKGRRQW